MTETEITTHLIYDRHMREQRMKDLSEWAELLEQSVAYSDIPAEMREMALLHAAALRLEREQLHGMDSALKVAPMGLQHCATRDCPHMVAGYPYCASCDRAKGMPFIKRMVLSLKKFWREFALKAS